MATFIALIDYTEKGIASIKESPGRAAKLAELAKARGAEVKAAYWTTGAHDGVLVLEAPDEQTAAAVFLSLGRAGNVRTQTLRAFSREEMESVLSRVS